MHVANQLTRNEMGILALQRNVNYLAMLMPIGLALIGPRTLIAQSSDTPESNARVIVTISVDWEGVHLLEPNLKAFEAFRENFPNVPLTHFLNAAHYCRGESAESITKKIRRVIREEDEVGLHIHCWRSLVETAEVKYRNKPTFWGKHVPVRTNPNGDEGHEIELTAYTANEVEKVAAKSVEILEENGFDISNSFRAPGWVASKEVLEGIRKAGFKVDSSSTDRTWHKDELGKFRIYGRLQELWPEVNQHTQPYEISTASGTLLEMPDTGALADYITSDEMDFHLKEVIARTKKGETRFAHFGFHQESAERFLPRLTNSLAKWEGIGQIEFMTLENAAKEYYRQNR